MTQHFYFSSLSSLNVFSNTAEWEVMEEVKEICKGKKNVIFSFLVALGLHSCIPAFSSCSEQGLLFIEVHGLLVAAFLVTEHGL